MTTTPLFTTDSRTVADISSIFGSTLEANAVRFDGRDDLPDVFAFLNDIRTLLIMSVPDESAGEFFQSCHAKAERAARSLYVRMDKMPARQAPYYRKQINVIRDLSKRFMAV